MAKRSGSGRRGSRAYSVEQSSVPSPSRRKLRCRVETITMKISSSGSELQETQETTIENPSTDSKNGLEKFLLTETESCFFTVTDEGEEVVRSVMSEEYLIMDVYKVEYSTFKLTDGKLLELDFVVAKKVRDELSFMIEEWEPGVGQDFQGSRLLILVARRMEPFRAVGRSSGLRAKLETLLLQRASRAVDLAVVMPLTILHTGLPPLANYNGPSQHLQEGRELWSSPTVDYDAFFWLNYFYTDSDNWIPQLYPTTFSFRFFFFLRWRTPPNQPLRIEV